MLKGLRNFLRGGEKLPAATSDTFFVWEPCSYSHAEVTPGYARYLRELGFKVRVLLSPRLRAQGLFSRVKDDGLSVHYISRKKVLRHFLGGGLGQAAGLLVTTTGKITKGACAAQERAVFSYDPARQKILFVEHDVRKMGDENLPADGVISLRRPHYKGVETAVVNPHFFGDVALTAKNGDCTHFITIGALRAKRRNTEMLLGAVRALHDQGVRNFKILVVGKGKVANLPRELRPCFEFCGHLNFERMYARIEQADFFLPLLDADNPQHERYITTGTSGTFQLVYGFAKPCLIAEKFAAVNGFDAANAIVYKQNTDLAQAMRAAIDMPAVSYDALQQSLEKTTATLYHESLENMRKLIDAN